MIDYSIKKELVDQHIRKVKEAIKEKRLHFVCLEGCSHRIKTFDEYMRIINDDDFVFYIYGI